jgi:5-methylthioadenosine/S-adenosylhomocysteine deaminase
VQKADYIICGEYVLAMDAGLTTLRQGAVAVQGHAIVDVGKSKDLLRIYPDARVIAAENKVLLPGLINTHSHAAMVYFRGLADDLPLREWLEKHIWPAESRWLST